MRWPVLVLLAACTAPPPPCSTAPAVYTEAQLPLGIAGEPMTIAVIADSCAAVLSAEVSVLDPSSREVSAEATAFDKVVEDTKLMYVTFRPLRPGPHHLTVRVQPNVGLLQLDLDVAADLRQAQWSYALDAASFGSCPRVDVLTSGRVVCLTSPDARSGNVVWRSDGGSISRWVDRGDAGLQRDPDVLLALGAQTLLPAEDDVFAVSKTAQLTRIIVDGGGLQQLATLEPSPAPQLGWVAWRTSAAAGIYNGSFSFALAASTEGIFTAASSTPTLQRWSDFTEQSHPLFTNFQPVPRLVVEWDTAPLLHDGAAGNTVVAGWDAGFNFALYGTVTGATTQWVTVSRDGRLYLMRR